MEEIRMDQKSRLKTLLFDYTQRLNGKFLRIDENDDSETEQIADELYEAVIDLKKLNERLDIDAYFQKTNRLLSVGGVFIGCVQTHDQLRACRKIDQLFIIGTLYKYIEFAIHRVLPKIKGGKKIYNLLTGGKRRRLTKTEVLGRLVKYGFNIEHVEENIEGKLFFISKKRSAGNTGQKTSVGLLFKMPRIGKDGKMIRVLKFRTMHPYSEYLQDYIIEKNGYGEKGKPADDFRLTIWGRVMRKYWLDEIPQLINVFRGEMKIVGVRPISRCYFKEIPEDLKKLRTSQKPGCIPPYLAFNRPSSKEGVIEAEKSYLSLDQSYGQDAMLCFQALKNILIKRRRGS